MIHLLYQKPTDFFGMRVHIIEPAPRYSLPEDVPPGTGSTREDFAKWSARVCGYREDNIICIKTPRGLYMTRGTFEAMKTSMHKDTSL